MTSLRLHRLALPVLVALGSTAPAAWALSDPDRHISLPDAIHQIKSLRDAQAWMPALSLIERTSLDYPGNDDLHVLRVHTLTEAGAAEEAWRLYRQRPQLFSESERSRLEADHYARRVTWSSQYAESDLAPRADAQAAEDILSAYLRDSGLSIPELPARTQLDRLVALNRLARYQEVVDEYDRITAAGHAVPAYAMAAVADALMALQHPERAAHVLDSILPTASNEDPATADLRIQRAYAALESEQHAQSRTILRSLRDEHPAWRLEPGAKGGWENWPRYEADRNLALVHAFGEDHNGAQQRLESLVAVGPANPTLQTSLGMVYMFRGWPERALERYRIAETLDDRDLQARIGQVNTLTTLQRDDLAHPIHDRLLARYPDQLAVRRMEREWRIHRGWQWRAYATGGRSEGGDGLSPLGSHDRAYGVELQSPIIGDRWRIVAGREQRWADFEQQRAHNDRNSIGVVYAYDQLNLGLRANRASDNLGGMGLALSAGWRFNDQWNASAELRQNDVDGSMQARIAGITADSLRLGAQYRPSELTDWSASVSRLRYDDGNTRNTLSVTLDQRLSTHPHFLLNGIAGLYASVGSRDDTPYFNPSRDASLELGVRADHLVWRRYDRHFRHRLTLGAGPYWQDGHGSSIVPAARYEHQWQFALGRRLIYGLSWSRPVYDGQREERIGLDAEFKWGEQ